MEQEYLKEYYDAYDEEGRLLSKHGQVEYRTTMKYIHDYLGPGMRVLEVGAGTGRYSLALAHEGCRVDAVELVETNLEQLKRGILPTDEITAVQGTALDLSRYPGDSFDLTLVLGPLYHLYAVEDKLTALREAVRVTKPGGVVMVAYCMNEATMIEYCFKAGKLWDCLEAGMLAPDYHCLSQPKDLFELVRVEDIDRLNRELPVERLLLVAADGATNYMRETVDAMDDRTFEAYLDYHFHICERQDLIGATHHSLDILRKNT